MAGCELYAITGIDGDFHPGEKLLANLFENMRYLSYDRGISFQENASVMREKISSAKDKKIILLGWSIGGAMALHLANCRICTKSIAINSFFHRRQYLSLRNISISDEEDFDIQEQRLQSKKILVIAGGNDEKIPYTDSIRIYEYLKSSNDVTLCIFSESHHSLDSFSEKAKEIIRAFIYNS